MSLRPSGLCYDEFEEFFEAKDSARNWADYESVRPALLEDLEEASSELSKAVSNRVNIDLGLPRPAGFISMSKNVSPSATG